MIILLIILRLLFILQWTLPLKPIWPLLLPPSYYRNTSNFTTITKSSISQGPTRQNKKGHILPHQTSTCPANKNLQTAISSVNVATSLTTYLLRQNRPFPTGHTVIDPNNSSPKNTLLVLDLASTGPTIYKSPPKVFGDNITSLNKANIPSTLNTINLFLSLSYSILHKLNG